ncbi:acyltransferase family protein [Providencia rettgeri]|uniref:acyltransferase family protein n=1 Tax=Providencia rettgeri TaxID=587 RepID=UPI001BA462DA|nr:acyltransferase [Providencia rettgeri]MBS0916400.1 acyltransferase [Providencia rettgeri]
MPKNVLSIHYIRGISALLVVLFHFRGVINDVYAQNDLGHLLFRWGEIGVDVFFVISGFIICLSTKNTNRPGEFIAKRFFRIYPAYLFFIIISMLIGYYFSSINTADVINAIFILPADYSKGSPFFGYSYLIVAWSLFYEICFYAIYVISMAISHRYRNLICSLLILLMVFIPQVVVNGRISASPLDYAGASWLGYFNIFTSPMMLIFIVGILIYECVPIIKLVALRLDEWVIRVLFYSSASFFIYCFMTGYNSWHGLTNSVVFIAPIIMCAILFEIRVGVKKSTFLSFLGDISYSLYLSHLIVLLLLSKFGGVFYHSSTGFSRLFILVSLSLITAYISFNLIEKPSAKLCRKLLTEKRP